MRLAQLLVSGQELMTRDKVSLRLSVTVEYAVVDPTLALHAVAQVRDTVYLLTQMASREYVASVTLDELLAGRDAMTRFLEEYAVPKARAVGVRVERVGVKDIVLPGEMRALLNRVIEAEKEAAANVILRREETAAMRSLANTARVMAESPVLLRLKELESLKEIAGRIHEVRVVVGADGMKTLLPAGLLAGASDEPSRA
jgi:regulator of protease activity HflC (stomatin/prohibitin superfamily)